MNRLTETGLKFLTPMQARKDELIAEIKRHQKYYDKLAAYEDTGLEPEEIDKLKGIDNWNTVLKKQYSAKACISNGELKCASSIETCESCEFKDLLKCKDAKVIITDEEIKK